MSFYINIGVILSFCGPYLYVIINITPSITDKRWINFGHLYWTILPPSQIVCRFRGKNLSQIVCHFTI